MNARAESNFTERRQAAIGRPLASGGNGTDDGDVRERVAALEATIGTIRAEMRANAAETREAVVTAFERLRADTTTQMHSFKVWALAGVASFLVAVILILLKR